MMAKQGVTLDTVMIKVESNAGKSVSNIDKLSASLMNLKQSISGGFGQIKNLGENLTTLSKGMNNIAKIDIQPEKFKQLAEAIQPLSALDNTKGMNNFVKNMKELPQVFENIDEKTLANVARVATELSKALTPLSEKLAQVSQGFSNISVWADKYGVSVTKIRDYSKQTDTSMKTLKQTITGLINTFKKTTSIANSFYKQANKGFTSLKSKIKQVALSLIGTRTAFTMIRKAVSEYMALDEQLTKYTTNVWRAFGAQLAPAIEYAMYLFKQFVRVIYSVILALTGIDLISRANQKAMEAYGKSVKDTLGNLQKFDDLNVVEFPKDTGSGSDDNLIDLDTIDLTPIQWLIDLVKKLKDEIKEAFDTGQWYGVGEAIANIINESLTHIPWETIQSKFNRIATQFGNALNGVIENTDWKSVGNALSNAAKTFYNTLNTLLTTINWKAVGEGITNFIEGYDLAGVLKSKFDVFVSGADAINKIFDGLDTAKIGQELSKAADEFLKGLNRVIDTVEWGKIGEKIKTAIKNIDWKGLWDDIVKLGDSAFDGVTEFFSGLTGVDSDEIKKIAEALVTIGEAFVTYKLVSKVADLTDAFAKNASAISPWTLLFSGIAAIVTQVAKAFDAIDKADYEKVQKIVDSMKLLTLALLALGVVVGVIALLKEKFGGLGSGLKDSTTATKKAGSGFSDLFKSLGKAGEIIAVLGGLALVINQITNLLKTFSETGMSVQDGLILVGGILGEIAIGFAAIAASTNLLDEDSLFAMITIFAGMSAVLLSLSVVLDSCAKLGGNLNSVFTGLNSILATLTVFMAALVISGKVLGSDPEVLLGVAVVTAAICATLLVLAATLPTILDAVGKFINQVAPDIQNILTTIGEQIQGIIEQLGISLPPIINSIGNLFTKIFKGIENVIKAVGNVIVDIMNTADRNINNVLRSILSFIRELGPAIETFVNSAIRSITRLINFFIDGIEYLINFLIIDSVNSLLRQVKENKIIELLGVDGKIQYLSDVKLRDFAPALETGTNRIPQEGLYHLHPDEAVVPKKYNPAVGGSSYGEETNQKLDKLISVMENLNTTTIVNLGNKTLYKEQQSYNSFQNNKYGTINL